MNGNETQILEFETVRLSWVISQSVVHSTRLFVSLRAYEQWRILDAAQVIKHCCFNARNELIRQ